MSGSSTASFVCSASGASRDELEGELTARAIDGLCGRHLSAKTALDACAQLPSAFLTTLYCAITMWIKG